MSEVTDPTKIVAANGTSALYSIVSFLRSLGAGQAQGGPPSGSILAFGGTTLPSRWLWCDGTSYLRADYPYLFTAIGTAYGAADATHFNVPDLRGRFLRGQDQAVARDPDRTGRTASATGGNTGDNVGSVQTDAMQGHRHGPLAPTTNFAGSGGAALLAPGTVPIVGVASTDNPVTDGTNGTPRTSSETRPINLYARFIIKT